MLLTCSNSWAGGASDALYHRDPSPRSWTSQPLCVCVFVQHTSLRFLCCDSSSSGRSPFKVCECCIDARPRLISMSTQLPSSSSMFTETHSRPASEPVYRLPNRKCTSGKWSKRFSRLFLIMERLERSLHPPGPNHTCQVSHVHSLHEGNETITRWIHFDKQPQTINLF